MKGMIDETELARLEKLASAGYGGPFIDLTSLNNSEMRVAIPALVAEVRRLRKERDWLAKNKDCPAHECIDDCVECRKNAAKFALREAVHADRE